MNEVVENTEKLASDVLTSLRRNGEHLATAESCTGGLIAGALTEIPGSSDVFDRGFVTYSNDAKMDLLKVPEDALRRHGAVSPEVARAMAEGALLHSKADLTVAVTGVAGPGGGSDDKPVGLVFIGLKISGFPPIAVERRYGPLSRSEIRGRTVADALELLLAAANGDPLPLPAVD